LHVYLVSFRLLSGSWVTTMYKSGHNRFMNRNHTIADYAAMRAIIQVIQVNVCH